MECDNKPILSFDVLLEWARFLRVNPKNVRPGHIEPQIKRLLDEFNRLEEIDLTNVEPSTRFLTMQEMKNGKK